MEAEKVTGVDDAAGQSAAGAKPRREKIVLDTPDFSDYRGILIVVEQRAGLAKKVSWQLLGEGRSSRLREKCQRPNLIKYDISDLLRGHGETPSPESL